ncbi:MAG TPA: isoprenylcysteine carboxylmethyltransferase family protein [Candidatus Polarisedimenticolia bacterium]|nr:isoprenylcysteine carboxylmethyltransferase family protein [Candidatus Polarisedimenticolia bacterium]
MPVVKPTMVILAVLALGVILYFRDALHLSISRPGRRFTQVHPWEKWLHPAKAVAVAAWLWVVGATDLDRPIFPFLPDAAVAAVGWAGVGLAVSGTVFACWAKVTLGAQFASRLALHEHHALITTGPYRITRHPIYTGVLLILWGVVLAGNSLAGLLTWGGFFSLMLYVHTIGEESLLESRFGETYRAYRNAVPRLLPRV